MKQWIIHTGNDADIFYTTGLHMVEQKPEKGQIGCKHTEVNVAVKNAVSCYFKW